jgi:multidrug resistance efflux pump
MNKRLIFSLIIFMIPILGLSACSIGGVTVNLSGQQAIISASGTIETSTVRIAPEVAGKVEEVLVQKGSSVEIGTSLFTLDDALLQAKYEEVRAQVRQAEAAVEVAKLNLASAEAQYQLALETSRTSYGAVEPLSWTAPENEEFELPNWYFQRSESIQAAQADVDAAQAALDDELDALQKTLESATNKDFVNAEARVIRAQTAFQNADQTLTQAEESSGSDRGFLIDEAQKIYDQAKAELNAAQNAYDAMLTGTSATDVKEARARVAAAKARLENAQNTLNTLMVRDESRQVETAKTAVDTAKAGVTQAEANLAVARAIQKEVEVQLEKTTVSASVAGVVLSNPVNAGETVNAGTTVYEIGPLDEVKLTVYVTEDQFGKIQIGDKADVVVDSFPGETFTGEVVYISDEAEFTPRNVQTVESRSTTVYAVEIQLSNPDHKLKPGMPADATIH